MYRQSETLSGRGEGLGGVMPSPLCISRPPLPPWISTERDPETAATRFEGRL